MNVTMTRRPAKAVATRRVSGRQKILLKGATGITLAVLWEVGVSLFAPPHVARPTGVVRAIPSVLTSADFQTAAIGTAVSVLIGVLVAVVIGTVLGILIGRNWIVDRVTTFYVNVLYSLPIIALLPLLTLTLGYTSETRLVLVVLAATLPIVFNVAEGARSVPREFLEVCYAYRAKGVNTLFEVILPSAIPYLMAGMNLAVGRALIAAVVAEFLTAIDGLGFFILFNSRSFNQDSALVGVIVLSLFGIALHELTRRLAGRVTPWHNSGRS